MLGKTNHNMFVSLFVFCLLYVLFIYCVALLAVGGNKQRL